MRTNLHLKLPRSYLALALVFVVITSAAFAQSTAFSYQGKLADNSNPANGQYDFQFKLFDTATVGTGTQQGSMFPASNVAVTAGIFTVQLDFGACPTCFNGAARFLEIAAKPTSGSTFTTLSPRQPVTATPYSIKSQNAATADGLSVACTNCVTSSQIASVSGNVVTGTIPVASVPAGSANYIQNTTSPQGSSNFNISGNGAAGGTLSGNLVSGNTVNATTQYNIAGLRVFTVNGPYNGMMFTASNTFAGDGAGLSTTPNADPNSFLGKLNAFFGAGAGQANTTGDFNAFFGAGAGQVNTYGNKNAFFGNAAGNLNFSGHDNAFFGNGAGSSNSFGVYNAFFGADAGHDNSIGQNNAFFGINAGFSNAVGNGNTFIGSGADFFPNTPGTGDDNNTLLGAGTTVNPGLNNATAIGSRARVEQSNSLILGAINGVGSCTSFNNCASVNVGIGTTSPGAVLDVQHEGSSIPQTAWFTAYGSPNEIFGRSSDGTRLNPTATPNGRTLLLLGATGHNGNGFVTVPRASIVMDAAQAWAPSATGTQIRFRTTANDTTTLTTQMIITNAGNVGIGTSGPADKLDVNGDIRVGAGTTGCVKDSDGTVIAGACSSDARLKRDITPFPHLLEKLVQLQPVHFYWRSAEFPDRHLGAAQSFGLVAQEVEKTMPELVTEDASGFKVIHYHKLPLLMLEAIKELKAENDVLKQKLLQIEKEQRQIESLTKIVCLDHPQAVICR